MTLQESKHSGLMNFSKSM